jgi:N-acetylneuraminate synthase
MIQLMKNKFGPIGWSDHTVSPAVIHYAVAMGAQAIEFHMDLEDRAGNEFKHGHCWRPQAIEAVIVDTIKAEGAMSEPPLQYRQIFEETCKWRNDPDDEMRPIKAWRDKLNAKN